MVRSARNIIALSSGSVPAGIAVVRLSGPDSLDIARQYVKVEFPPRELTYCVIREPSSGDIIDRCLGVFFPAYCSFTGENCFEFHLHGSPAVVSRLFSSLVSLELVRLAQPGEFIRRAYENGKVSLTSVEGVSDLLAAETENQRKLAVMRMEGGVDKNLADIRADLVALLGFIEAQIDFSTEEDVSSLDIGLVGEKIQLLLEKLRVLIADGKNGRIMREGIRVGFGGLPNVGKSSLINVLARSDVAIVSSEAGTTRDLKEVDIQIKGQLFRLIDSAGIRNTDSVAEQEGVRRAQDMLDNCDLVFWVCAPDVPGSALVPSLKSETVCVWNKCDMGNLPEFAHGVSAKKGDVSAIQSVLDELAEQVEKKGVATVISRQRDMESIAASIDNLQEIDLQDLEASLGQSPELVAEHVRSALYALDRLVGRVDAEDILDGIFSSFCVGK